ncbi:MAG: hypothetical protein R3Y56_03960 [Akkermansia sp.]
MKASQIITLGLATLVGTTFVAQAQEAAQGPKMEAVVQFGNKKPTKIAIDKASGKGKFIFTDTTSQQQMEYPVAQCKTFMLQSPADFLLASRLYRAGKLEPAVARLASVKNKYKNFVGLPGNPSTEAALMQVMAQIRLQDWAGLKSTLASFPEPNMVEAYQKPLLLVAGFLAVEDAEAASKLEAIQALLDKKADVDKLDLDVYGLLRLAQARGLAAQIPAAEWEAGLSEASAATASIAADYYCQAAMAMHGANPELVAYCMTSAAKLLWATPQSKSYLATLSGAKTCSPAQWTGAPGNFKDAAALAKMAQGIFGAAADEATAAIGAYYVNPNVPAAQ